MVTLKDARKGKMEDFIKEHDPDPDGDHGADRGADDGKATDLR